MQSKHIAFNQVITEGKKANKIWMKRLFNSKHIPIKIYSFSLLNIHDKNLLYQLEIIISVSIFNNFSI